MQSVQHVPEDSGHSSTSSILVVAGEASGDSHGGMLLRELKKLQPGIQAFGIGGDALEAEGTELLFHASETNVTGFVEVVKKYPFFRRVLSTVIAEAQRRRPAFAILVDYPGFNLRLAKTLHQQGIPVFYYIAPQVWAWKEGRVKILQRCVDELAVLFPFEVDYFAKHGVAAHFFGHPLVNRLQAARQDRVAGAKNVKDDDPRPLIAWLPGSRPNELRRHLPVILKTIQLLGSDYRHIIARADTVDPSYLTSLLGSVVGVEIHDDSSVVLQAADVAVVKSGTSTVQAALIGTPFCVIYKTSTVSYWIARTLATVDSLAMVNLLAGKKIVREYLQGECTAENLAEELDDLLNNRKRRKTMIDEFATLTTLLSEENSYTRTARFVAERFL